MSVLNLRYEEDDKSDSESDPDSDPENDTNVDEYKESEGYVSVKIILNDTDC